MATSVHVPKDLTKTTRDADRDSNHSPPEFKPPWANLVRSFSVDTAIKIWIKWPYIWFWLMSRIRDHHFCFESRCRYRQLFSFYPIILRRKLLETAPWSISRSFSSTLINYCWTWGSMSRDSSVGIATSYGLDDRGVAVRGPVGPRMFSSPRRPDRLWGPPSLSNGYRRLFLRG
jgi:hypothetical protein